jgi:integrase/recombinase XerC
MIVKSGLPTYLSRQQVRQLLAVITSLRDRALFTLTYFYGLRVSEASSLDRADLDLEQLKIRILRAKNGIPGEKPLFRSLPPLLRDYLVSRTDADPALFVGRQGRLKKRQIQALFRRYATLADLPPAHRHVHLMRHSIATHLLDAGEPIDFVKDHLGHRSMESTLVYARISDRRRTRTIRRLERSLRI